MIRFKGIHFECPPFLFGYGWWNTLWRLAVVVLAQLAVMVAAIAVVIYFFGYDDESRADPELSQAFLFIFAAIAVFLAVMLFVTHRINVKNIVKNEKVNAMDDSRHPLLRHEC